MSRAFLLLMLVASAAQSVPPLPCVDIRPDKITVCQLPPGYLVTKRQLPTNDYSVTVRDKNKEPIFVVNRCASPQPPERSATSVIIRC